MSHAYDWNTRRRPRGRRSGFSLVELLLTITASSMVMATATALLHRTLFLESSSRHVLQRERAALVLARQFRNDIHLARSVECSGDPLPDGMVLLANMPGDGVIEYRRTFSGLIREERLVAGRVAREQYACPEGTRWWAVREGRVVILRGEGDESSATAPPVAIEVVAILGARVNSPEARP